MLCYVRKAKLLDHLQDCLLMKQKSASGEKKTKTKECREKREEKREKRGEAGKTGRQNRQTKQANKQKR